MRGNAINVYTGIVAYIENRMVTFLCFFFCEIVNVSAFCVFRGRATGLLLTAFTPRFIFNEGVSLLENASYLGLPVPRKLKSVLEQLHDRAEKEDSNNDD